MSTFKEISEYYSDTNGKKAQVLLEVETHRWIVRGSIDTGTTFSSEFITEEDAEAFAEDWVL